MNMSTMREDFEASYEERYGYRPARHFDGYTSAPATAEWAAWQAATLRVVQPQQDYVERGMELSLRCAEAELHEIVQCREALRSHLSMRLQAVPPTDTTEALRRLFPLFEGLLTECIFTAEQAGKVLADMNTLRGALAAAPTPKER